MFKLEEMLCKEDRKDWSGDLTIGSYTGKQIKEALWADREALKNGTDTGVDGVLTPRLISDLDDAFSDSYSYRLYVVTEGLKQGIKAEMVHSPCIDTFRNMINLSGVWQSNNRLRRYTGKEIKELVKQILGDGTVYWWGLLDRTDFEAFSESYITGEYPIADNKLYWLSFGGYRGSVIVCRKWESNEGTVKN